MKTAMEMGWGERTVTVNREKLITTLKANKQKHLSDYRSAVDGYKAMMAGRLMKMAAAATAEIDKQYEALRSKIEDFDIDDPDSPIADRVTLLREQVISLRVPKDHSKSYEVALQMAEWEVGENVELTQSQFQCFVMDDWEWKADFVNVSNTYMAR